MTDRFTYEWHELAKKRKINPKLLLQAFLLAVVVGIGPELVLMLMGRALDVYQLRFMMVVIPVVVALSVNSYYTQSAADITTSSLIFENDLVRISRHVTAETGRRFYAVWDSLEIKNIRIDEFHRVIQIDADWQVRAYRMKGTEAGKFVDVDERSYPQTLRLSPESFYDARAHLEKYCFNKISEMTKEEYEKAKPFLLKHYEI